MSWLGAAIQGVGMIVGANEQAKARKQQRQQLAEARDFATKGPLNDYVKAGSGAVKQTNDLLGIGEDNSPEGTQASRTAFDKYLGSTGYKFQLGQGMAALDASSASKGLRGSGASIKAAVDYGQQAGSSYFDKYLGQLGGVANRGLSATTAQTNAFGGLSTQIGNSYVGGADDLNKSINDFADNTSDFLGFNDKSYDGASGSSGAHGGAAVNGIFGAATPAAGGGGGIASNGAKSSNHLFPGS